MSTIFDFCVASKKTNKEFRETKQTNMAIKRFRIFYGIRVLILTFQFHYIKVILIFLRNLHRWVKPRDRDGETFTGCRFSTLNGWIATTSTRSSSQTDGRSSSIETFRSKSHRTFKSVWEQLQKSSWTCIGIYLYTKSSITEPINTWWAVRLNF